MLSLSAIISSVISSASTCPAAHSRASARRRQHVLPSSVRKRDVESQLFVRARRVFGVSDRRTQLLGDHPQIAHDVYPHAVAHQIAQFVHERPLQERHEARDFARIASPVFVRAYTVSASTCHAAAHRVAVRSASTPRSWPAVTGSARSRAQRALPSMMMARWRGRARDARLDKGAGAAASTTTTTGRPPPW